MQTLAQLNQQLLEIAVNHVQIASYGFGTATHFEEALLSDDSLFPCVWLELEDFSGNEAVHTRNINIHITDVNTSQIEAFSKTEQVALDVLHLMRVKYEVDGMQVIKTHTMSPLAYRGVDHAHGFVISLEIEYADEYDACAAPTTPNIPPISIKHWNTTESKWEDYAVNWEIAGSE